MSVLILIPKEEETWCSVNRIISYIIETTKKENLNKEVVELVVDRKKIFSQIKLLINFEKIVVIDHSVETILVLKYLKQNISTDTSIYFHALGMAGILLWPLFKWELINVMNEKDCIILTCERDQKIVESLLKNVKTKVVPFDYIPKRRLPSSLQAKKNKFLYIGRISFQKNIHSILYELKRMIVEGSDAELLIVGEFCERNLPEFSIDLGSYEGYIKKIIKELNLENYVKITGKKTKSEIDELLFGQEYIFISLSLQIGENFGLAAYEALSAGMNAILSNWGGHQELKKIFPDQVGLVSVGVEKNNFGLFQDELHDTCLKVSRSGCTDIVIDRGVNECFELDKELIIKVMDKREHFKNLKNGEVIFENYDDEIFLDIARVYAGYKETKLNQPILKLLDIQKYSY